MDQPFTPLKLREVILANKALGMNIDLEGLLILELAHFEISKLASQETVAEGLKTVNEITYGKDESHLLAKLWMLNHRKLQRIKRENILSVFPSLKDFDRTWYR
jgi:hypothetical protein